ncbi:diguanylate cyclase domain-containing protein [Desulforamulus hydrothermalis]|uniref:Diguanylate cyclase n=1 Tax=Desulforamulus hydrothermalis Lam5 = DSM 18033 TaxID=1121428 RepID=K8E045_9FIRM|nr:diguanylate cyclase [Desulforamulus hydrothermalis]CCO08837.1 Diguanylate cyclase [Desulforamulus hydrothermalis Lam5 = DSM 18033]SHG72831.1 diguanylate cyclase (GGDEF) domain-containing protein [Desulforamulus hydrothermalis Lam5 = DSM 18033]
MNPASVRNLQRKCFYALTTLALLATAGYLNLYQIIETQEVSAAVINLSGRQRMLTQKAALLSLQLVESKRPEQQQKIRRELTEVITLLEKTHQGLIHGDAARHLPSHLSAQMRAIYFEPPDRLDIKMQTFIAASRALLKETNNNLSYNNPRLQYILSAAQGELLQTIDKAVSQYQAESEKANRKIQNFALTVLIVTLLVLTLEALLIFRPMIRLLRREAKQLSDYNIQLQQLSTHDALTGIANRRSFDEFIHRRWQQAAGELSWLAVIMVDIDYFKNYNDTYGHQAGDACLRQVAASLRDSLHQSAGLVARYGGEEFAVVLPNTDLKSAYTAAEILRQSIEDRCIPHLGSHCSKYVTVSLGVAATIPSLSGSPQSLIEQADQALYRAKNEGRNRVCTAASIITGAVSLL